MDCHNLGMLVVDLAFMNSPPSVVEFQGCLSFWTRLSGIPGIELDLGFRTGNKDYTLFNEESPKGSPI